MLLAGDMADVKGPAEAKLSTDLWWSVSEEDLSKTLVLHSDRVLLNAVTVLFCHFC